MDPETIVTEDGFTAREVSKLAKLVQPGLTPATGWPGLADSILFDYDAADALRYVTIREKVYRVEATDLTVSDLNRAKWKGHRLGLNIWKPDMVTGVVRNLGPLDRCGMVIAALFDTRLDRVQPGPDDAA